MVSAFIFIVGLNMNMTVEKNVRKLTPNKSSDLVLLIKYFLMQLLYQDI